MKPGEGMRITEHNIGKLPKELQYVIRGNKKNKKAKKTSVPMGWGDRLEAIFSKIGFTEELYIKIKERAGFSPTCNCPARKEFLNRIKGVLTIGFLKGGINGAIKAGFELADEIKRKHNP